MREKRPHNPEREGSGGQQRHQRVPLAVAVRNARGAEHQGQRRSHKERESYKDCQGTASPRVQDELQEHSHTQDERERLLVARACE